MPGASGTRATATLSAGWRWMAEFSAVGTFEIWSKLICKDYCPNCTPPVASGDYMLRRRHAMMSTLWGAPAMEAAFSRSSK